MSRCKDVLSLRDVNAREVACCGGEKPAKCGLLNELIGGGEWDRTTDPALMRRLLVLELRDLRSRVHYQVTARPRSAPPS